MIRETALVGCVLAGGKSTRMGSDKALLKFGSVTLIERSVAVLKSVFPSVVISSDRVAELDFPGIPVLPDIRKDCGPLGGIHAALTHTKADCLFVLACDMPFVSPDLIRYLISSDPDADAVVPSSGGRVHPLCGLYSRNGLPAIERALERGSYKLQDVLGELKTAFVPITSDLPFYRSYLLDNLNSVEDVERARDSGEV
ncbi:MAG: molybdenum cofactor guanylyltransferase [Bacteroidetes bacterium]|nr:molybdenum cofactor guanylyltransferase [Bacteroidota bacterium]MCW5894947.1 molybdenum cofactor guanylyltransferase [Bacteroidota bacterium]